MLCVISAWRWIEAKAYGADRYKKSKHAYVKLDGVELWKASRDGEQDVCRGTNMILVDLPNRKMQESHNFNTHDNEEADAQLSDYIKRLNDGNVVVCVSCDEASEKLRVALTTLNALGADVSDVRIGGAWVFVAEKGKPAKTVVDKELTESAANARQPCVTITFRGT